jgi:hypothetical protein
MDEEGLGDLRRRRPRLFAGTVGRAEREEQRGQHGTADDPPAAD